MNSIQNILYAHGFEGRAQGPKAEFLKTRLSAEIVAPCMWGRGWTLYDQVDVLLDALAKHGTPDLVVGSSMGGFAAALALQKGRYTQLPALLLAPAVGIHTMWEERLGPERFAEWSKTGRLTHFHGGAQREVELPFELWTQCRDEAEVIIPCPTAIIHGMHDEVVPIQSSFELARRSPAVVDVLEADAGHQLNNHLELIMDALDLLDLS